MELEPFIDRLPFVLQRRIMEYKPRLIMLEKDLEKHLRTRYCAVCGEYKDFIQLSGRKPPIHIHPKMMRMRFTRPKKRYEVIYGKIVNLFCNDRMAHTVSNTQYLINNEQHRKLTTRLLCRIRGPRFFYNFSRWLNGKSRSPRLSRDPRYENVFENPEIYIVDQDDVFVSNWKNKDTLQYVERRSTCHLEHVASIIRQVTIVHPFIVHQLFKRKEFYQFTPILLTMVDMFPRHILHYLSAGRVDKEDSNRLLLDVLRYNFHLLEHISERKIIQLFQIDRDFFFDLMEEHSEAQDYFYFVDSLEITQSARMLLFDPPSHSIKRKKRA